MVGGALVASVASDVGEIGRGGATSDMWGEQSKSAHVSILASAIALQAPAPQSLTFTEEKGETPN